MATLMDGVMRRVVASVVAAVLLAAPTSLAFGVGEPAAVRAGTDRAEAAGSGSSFNCTVKPAAGRSSGAT